MRLPALQGHCQNRKCCTRDVTRPESAAPRWEWRSCHRPNPVALPCPQFDTMRVARPCGLSPCTFTRRPQQPPPRPPRRPRRPLQTVSHPRRSRQTGSRPLLPSPARGPPPRCAAGPRTPHLASRAPPRHRRAVSFDACGCGMVGWGGVEWGVRLRAPRTRGDAPRLKGYTGCVGCDAHSPKTTTSPLPLVGDN